MLTYKSYYNIAQTYLCELISRRESSVNTRLGADHHQLIMPPISKDCSNTFLLTTQDSLILGDFNTHHPSWYSGSTDTRGRKMADSINGCTHGILIWDTPTRVPPNAEPSSPDVSLASTSLITSCSWQTLSTFSSDHLPIRIRLQMKTTPNQVYVKPMSTYRRPTGTDTDKKWRPP